jgi:hypothetical protein
MGARISLFAVASALLAALSVIGPPPAAAAGEWTLEERCGYLPGVVLPAPVWMLEPDESWSPPELRFLTHEGGAKPASALTASVSWGDGSSTPATVNGEGADCYAVSSPQHAYAMPGTYALSYTIHDVTNGIDHVFSPHQVLVWNPVPRLLAPFPRQIHPTVGIPWHGVLGEFTVESPWNSSFYEAEAQIEDGRPAEAVSISGGHERLIVSGTLTYARPFDGPLRVSLRRAGRGVVGTWVTLSVGARARAAARIHGRPMLVAGAGGYELIFRLDRALPETRSHAVAAAVSIGAETRPVRSLPGHRSHHCYAAKLSAGVVASGSAGSLPFTLAVGSRTITQIEGRASLATASSKRVARQLGC